DKEIEELTAHFKATAVADNGRVFQVRPTQVFEIAFDQIQKSDRHASGYALRFPRIKCIRHDKRPIDADRLDRVIEIFRSITNMAYVESPLPPQEPTLFDDV
ncbi:MAG: hypothetical protein JO353_05750, partial [Phycisphaerae bacterium]|nr:hypothetical protein [Phycisphaerae bacterium]